LLSTIESCKEYKNILLGYHLHIIVFTDHKNNTFNGLKAGFCDFIWLLLLEEYGVTLKYFQRNKQKNLWIVKDALSRLDIDSLMIQEEEILRLLSGTESNSISNISN
jgi:hypothetical protein